MFDTDIDLNDPVNAKFQKNLANLLLMIGTAWENFVRDEANSEELVNTMVLTNSNSAKCKQHKFYEFGAALDEVEEQLNSYEAGSAKDREHLRKAISSKIQALVQIADVAISKIPKHLSDVDSGLSSGDKNQQPSYKNIYILSVDEALTAELATQIGYYGYRPQVFTKIADVVRELDQSKYEAIIVDYDLFSIQNIQFEEIQKIISASVNDSQKDVASATSPAMVVISSMGDFNTRLIAARNGCSSFFLKPVNSGMILDKVDSIISANYGSEPYRILMIDDSPVMTKFVTRTLTQAGMSVHVETSPDRALNAISEFNPELILMDMYMPGCDGQEAAKIIRQYESLVGIPIVFFSSETDMKKQLAAMKIGADDFLTKPIDPENLIESVTIRVKRHRTLCSLMNQDSLTGLLNHTKIKQRLSEAILKAKRNGSPVSFAMVDIDKFKSVNDTYGHHVGDRVIKSLSRLLQTRLRKTDTVGRYGGEEFAVILWDTTEEMAYNVIDQIREDFTKISQIYEGGTFTCSFSSGISSSLTFSEVQELSIMADKALYVSKKSGRNRVTIATTDIDVPDEEVART